MFQRALRHPSPLLVLVFLCFGVPKVFAQNWSNLPSVKKARSEATVVDYRGDIYVFNGFGPDIKIENTIEKFDVATKTWSLIGSTSVQDGTAVTHNGIVRVGKDVWLIGGRIGNHPGAVSKKVWIYNLDTGAFRRGTDLPVGGAGGGAALVNNKIHWFGGLDSEASCDVDGHYVFDLGMPSAGWQNITSIARMPVPRNHFSTAVVDGWIYTIGGQFGHDSCPGKYTQDVSLVHAFNTNTNTWVRKADLPSDTSHTEPSTFAHGGYIYSVGGQVNGDKVFRYNPQQNTWTTVVTLPERLLAPVARIVDNKLMVAAGGAPNTKNPTVKVRTIAIPLPTLTSDVNSDVVSPDKSLISVEAEFHDTLTSTATHQWTNKSLADASNDDAMVTTPNIGELKQGATDSPMMSYLLYFAKSETHYLWVRGWGDTDASGNGGNDSLHAGLNGKVAASADKIDQFPAGWNWSRHTRDGAIATLNIPSPGFHAFNVWMREDGLAVDKFVITSDPDYVPTGKGPSPTDGTEELTTGDTGNEDTGTEDTGTEDTGTEDTGTEDTGTEDTGSDAGGNSTTDTASSDGSNNDGTNTEDSSAQDNGFQSIDGLVSIEVEHYLEETTAGSHRWIAGSRTGASGGASMVTNLDNGSIRQGNANSPMMSYSVDFKEAGTYSVWMRGWGDTVLNEGKNDSVHVGINGTLGSAQALQNFPAGWHWSREKRGGGLTTVVVPYVGTHTINIWMREDGIELDKLILSLDSSYQPQDTGTEETAVDNAGNTETTQPAGDDETPVDSGSEPATDDGSAEQNIAFQGSNGAVSIEVEHFSSNVSAGLHQWSNGSKPQASGAGSLVTSPNNGTIRYGSADSPMMSYRVNFDQPGSYNVWLRGWGDTVKNEGKNDSVHVGINGTLGSAAGLQGFPDGWNWSNEKRGGGTTTVYVPSAGIHTINIWMREDGLTLDKLVLTKDSSYLPVGTGPTESDGGFTGSDSSETGSTNTSSEGDTTTEATSADESFATVSTNTTWKNQPSSDGSKVVARHEAGGVVFDGKIYVLGGRGTRAVSVYDPALKKWTKKSAPPIELNHFQPVVWNNKIWVVGAFTGKYPDESPVANIYTYAPATDTWAKDSSIPSGRRRGGAGAALYNGAIYLLGGNTQGHKPGAKPWFDRFDPATGQWQTLPNAPTARDHATIAISGTRLVAAAGRQSSFPDVFGNMIAKTDIFNFASGKWYQGASITTMRAGTMTVTVGNEIIVIGGETKGVTQARKTVEAFDVMSNKWRTLKPLITGRHSGAAVVTGNKIHVITGSENLGGAPESVAHETLSLD